MNFILFILVSLLPVSGINKGNADNFSYSINTYFIDHKSGFAQKILHPFYSFNSNLIELVLRTNTAVVYDEETKESVSKVTYDTIGVQLIDLRNKTYYLADGFNENCKILKRGDYKESPIGLKLGLSYSAGTNDLKSEKFKDTICNGIKYQYYKSIPGDKGFTDSLETISFFQNEANLTTIYNIPHISNKYRFCGFSIYHFKEAYEFKMIVEDIKPMSNKDILICENILHKCEQFLK